MSRSLVLDTIEIEDSFFEESRLIAIRTSMQGYRFCWHLNHYLKLDIKRSPAMDICMDISARATGAAGTLFADMSLMDDKVYFPVYHYQYPLSEASILIYTNKNAGNTLLPEIGQADLLMLIQYGAYLENQMQYEQCVASIPETSWVREMNIDKIKARKNLIV